VGGGGGWGGGGGGAGGGWVGPGGDGYQELIVWRYKGKNQKLWAIFDELWSSSKLPVLVAVQDDNWASCDTIAWCGLTV